MNAIPYEQFVQEIESTELPTGGTCPVTPVLNMLQGKWKIHILFELSRHDTSRFGALKKALPQVTNTMLTSKLRELESYDLIMRTQYNEIPPHVEYFLSEKGRDLMPLFYDMYIWGMKYNTDD